MIASNIIIAKHRPSLILSTQIKRHRTEAGLKTHSTTRGTVDLSLVAQYGVKRFFVHKTVDVKLAAHMQTIITCHLTGSLDTELWDELNDLTHTVERNNVAEWHAVGSEASVNKEHLYVGGRSDNTEIVYHLIMQVGEIEEIDIDEWMQLEGKVDGL
jgi:hypothetical protein